MSDTTKHTAGPMISLKRQIEANRLSGAGKTSVVVGQKDAHRAARVTLSGLQAVRTQAREVLEEYEKYEYLDTGEAVEILRDLVGLVNR